MAEKKSLRDRAAAAWAEKQQALLRRNAEAERKLKQEVVQAVKQMFDVQEGDICFYAADFCLGVLLEGTSISLIVHKSLDYPHRIYFTLAHECVQCKAWYVDSSDYQISSLTDLGRELAKPPKQGYCVTHRPHWLTNLEPTERIANAVERIAAQMEKTPS